MVHVKLDRAMQPLPLTTVYHKLTPVDSTPYTLFQTIIGNGYPVSSWLYIGPFFCMEYQHRDIYLELCNCSFHRLRCWMRKRYFLLERRLQQQAIFDLIKQVLRSAHAQKYLFSCKGSFVWHVFSYLIFLLLILQDSQNIGSL